MDGGEQKIYSDQASRNVLTNSEKQEPLRMELCQQAERRREEGQGRTGGQEEEVGAKEGRNRGMEGGLINGSSAISSSLAPGRVQRRDEVGGGRRVSTALHSLRPPCLSACASSLSSPTSPLRRRFSSQSVLGHFI